MWFDALVTGLENNKKGNVKEKLLETLEQIKQTSEESEEEETMNGK